MSFFSGNPCTLKRQCWVKLRCSMLFGKNREILGKLSEDFCLRVVTRPETQAWAKEAITCSGRWNKRDCPNKPLLRMVG